MISSLFFSLYIQLAIYIDYCLLYSIYIIYSFYTEYVDHWTIKTKKIDIYYENGQNQSF